MRPVDQLERGTAAFAETERLTLHGTRHVVCLVRGQAFIGAPLPKEAHGFSHARRIGLHRALQAIDLPPLPLLQG